MFYLLLRMRASLEWKHVTYIVHPKRSSSPKEILHDLSGSLKSGEFLAILGPSGSGKTSLLNALAGRLVRVSRGCRLYGSIEIKGHPSSYFALKKRISYITQVNIHGKHTGNERLS